MAVPKRRMSRANTRSRRAQWKAKRPELVGVTVAGQQHKVPRRLLKAARLGLIDLDRRYRGGPSGAPLRSLSGDGMTLWLCAYLSLMTIALYANPCAGRFRSMVILSHWRRTVSKLST